MAEINFLTVGGAKRFGCQKKSMWQEANIYKALWPSDKA
jgi:hypothetical protein